MSGPSSSAEPAAEVVAAQQEWISAVLTNDADVISRLMHRDWAIVTPVGPLGSQQFLQMVREGVLRHTRMQPAPAPDGVPRVRVYGAVAVLTQRLLSTEINDGHTRDNDEWVTALFIRSEGRWVVALEHLTPA